ncbi:MAG: bifunctional phosphopantothenoylcysteine decarboxylase/phosphopantothenate--cysteine ligase CoaBC [Spirochaetes bacterium]|nr:bifunctional phosphopantothenoylcysteine decarboxylase/phosphopantothenate--cysteine ligase CoaBC [Spirochaetota bacterium]
MLKDKNIVLVVTGGIAAFKAISLASQLKKAEAQVYVVMTKNACRFITPLSFKSITRNKVTVEMFDESDYIPHISLTDLAELIIVAPATANIIAKAANGIADDMASTLLLSSEAPKLFVPAMNTRMYLNQITQRNIKNLTEAGARIMEPDYGLMSCGTTGPGRFPEVERIMGEVEILMSRQKSWFKGREILITLGGTIEDIDPVRFITNRSSGKMGLSLAEELIKVGAEVTLIVGNVDSAIFEKFSKKYIQCTIEKVRSAEQMYEVVKKQYSTCDVLFMAAAVADYKPDFQDDKVKKQEGEFHLPLKRTKDILKSLAKDKNKIHIGFAAESQNLEKYAKEKLMGKGLDFIVANQVKGEKAAIGTDQSELFLYHQYEEKPINISYGKKEDNAVTLIQEIEKIIKNHPK